MADLPHSPPETRIGQRVGDYTLERLIGRGGMSSVYFGRHWTTGRAAAVKIVHRDLPENIDADRRLEQEARAIARIDHEHVVKVFDLGWTQDGLPFLAMEYLEGVALSVISGQATPLPVRRTVDIALQILEALQKAHELSIIHRDLKPENILLIRQGGRDDYVKMLDFGIAKLLGKQPHSLVHTRRGVVLGTPEYLPPEIAMDLAVSPATDIYALGVILFEALTGRLPFTGRGAGDLAEKHCFTPPPRPRSFNSQLPQELEQIVLTCLSKEPRQRYDSAAALATALRPFAVEMLNQATQVGIEATSTPPDRSGSAHASAEQLEREVREEIARRWQDRTMPSTLQRSLTRLDTLSDRVLELETELAVVDDTLETLERTRSPTTDRLTRLRDEESAQEARREALAAQEARLCADLAQFDAKTEDLLQMMRLGSEPTTSVLHGLLSPAHIEATGERVRERSTVERLETDLRRVLQELERVATAQSDATLRRTRVETEALTEASQRQAEKARKLARRRVLLAEIDFLRRAQTHAIYQFALDLAVSIGH